MCLNHLSYMLRLCGNWQCLLVCACRQSFCGSSWNKCADITHTCTHTYTTACIVTEKTFAVTTFYISICFHCYVIAQQLPSHTQLLKGKLINMSFKSCAVADKAFLLDMCCNTSMVTSCRLHRATVHLTSKRKPMRLRCTESWDHSAIYVNPAQNLPTDMKPSSRWLLAILTSIYVHA